jgi:hypothetical protein
MVLYITRQISSTDQTLLRRSHGWLDTPIKRPGACGADGDIVPREREPNRALLPTVVARVNSLGPSGQEDVVPLDLFFHTFFVPAR